ncbi:MAG TPA: hypothetical protein VN520_31585 [Streptomyces sp.]|uniref:hypothetical protein n=1 Tax=Streptomyces sp. TaxID=1931 RepID=UPI002C19F025|nr:hypothetical protein [Streptomyces sp.]HWU10843.1 hypothetical protein [Streptomyces sp.]
MPRPRRRSQGWPTPRAGTLDLTCPAPSSTPGHTFTLTLTGAWEEQPSLHPHHSPEAVATDHALTLARNITNNYPATDTLPAAARINTLLGRRTTISHAPLTLLWATVHLTAEPDAVSAAIRHQRHAEEREQHHAEQSRRLADAQSLRDTLMSDPSLALAYWFATAPQSLDTDTLKRLEELLATAATYAPQGQWAPLARLLHTFAGRLSVDAKIHLIDALATLTDRYGHPDLTTDIQALRPEPAEDAPRSPGITLNGSVKRAM